MLTKIKIERFKALKSIEIELKGLNVIIGANNAGKSSIIQALQFAASTVQTSKIYTIAKFKNDYLSTTISPEQLMYAPLKDVYMLAYNGTLKEAKDQGISVTFFEFDEQKKEDQSTNILITKGRNKNIVVGISGKNLYEKLSSIEKPYCMYVPGLAGIPFEEEIRPVGAIRRAAAKGDSNTIFRNVLYRLNAMKEQWEHFLSDLRVIFPNISLEITSDTEIDGIINVKFNENDDEEAKPIDLAGTGVLQAIQIAAYVNYFRPELLLLDEPDSHLHPNNQKMLAQLLAGVCETNKLSIIISTHSRHLMNALKDDANFYMVKDGQIVTAPYSHYTGLLELGALDEYDMLRTGEIKFVVLTEDSSAKSQKMLESILISSGYEKNEFKIYSYNSISKVESANLFSAFLMDLNPELRVVVHRDRDGLYDVEMEKEIQEGSVGSNDRLFYWITHYNDLEAYFCMPSHICAVCHSAGHIISIEDANSILERNLDNVKKSSVDKLVNHRHLIEKKNKDKAQISRKAYEEYEKEPLIYAYGKALKGLIMQSLQERFGENINLIFPSQALDQEELRKFHG